MEQFCMLCMSVRVGELSEAAAAARLLRSWVRIPPRAWKFLGCVCCQVEVSATN
jgi:hypothetical protein